MSGVVSVPVATMWSGPDAPRDRDALATAVQPDIAGWVASLDRDGREGLHGRTLTQALAGEPVEVLSERSGWAEVVLPWQPSSTDPRGYRGWVRRSHVAEHGSGGRAEPHAVVTTPTLSASDTAVTLSYGTILPLVGSGRDTVRLRMPDGAVITVGAGSVLPVHDLRADRETLLASARQFLGLRYLWGGTCGWGMDCSGFVHLAYRVAGVTVPRDAFDQADASTPRELAETRPGDLYFFARPGERTYHVGFATGPQHAATDHPTMLHAPESGELIEDAPLAPHRRDNLEAAGSYPLH